MKGDFTFFQYPEQRNIIGNFLIIFYPMPNLLRLPSLNSKAIPLELMDPDLICFKKDTVLGCFVLSLSIS